MKNQINEVKRMQVLAGIITENESTYSDNNSFDRIEKNGDLFIENPLLKQYITNKDEYGFSIMEVPVSELEKATNMDIKTILSMDEEDLSISLNPTSETVDIILDRV
jgi:hypothetical protein